MELKFRLLALILLQSSFLYGFIEIDKNNTLNSKELLVIDVLVKDLQNILPPLIRKTVEQIQPTLTVKNIETDTKNTTIALFEPHLLGQNQIILSKFHLNQISQLPNFGKNTSIKEAFQSSQPILSYHKNYYQYVLSALIHESGHLFDLYYKNPQLFDKISKCQEDAYGPSYNHQAYGYLSNDCRRLIAMSNAISNHPLFLNAAGYAEQGLLNEVSNYHRSNFLTLRSMDPYEWKNPEENFAVNLEYFLLDPEYKCRKSVLYKIYSHFLNVEPFKDLTCQSSHIVFVAPNISRINGYFYNIDFSRVYAIHYLFAGEGPELASRFGHSMLRLIICSPQRKVIDEKCLNDIDQHLVVSFRASIMDLNTEILKGLNGSYPSVEYIFSMSSIISEYTERELRLLKSLPLVLNNEEKTSLLDAIIETHWTYEGQYKFLTNNCADETLQLLKRGLPYNEKVQELTISRPDTLFNDLKRIGIADASVLNNKSKAIQNGYFYPSMQSHYDESTKILIKNNLLEEDKNSNYYFSLSSFERSNMISKALADNATKNNQELFISLMLLEQHLLNNSESTKRIRALNSLVESLQKNGESWNQNSINSDSSPNVIFETLKESLNLIRTPAYLINMIPQSEAIGYGMPSDSEMKKLMTYLDENQKIKKIQNTLKKFNKNIDSYLDPTFLTEYQKTIENNNILRTKIKSFSVTSNIEERLLSNKGN